MASVETPTMDALVAGLYRIDPTRPAGDFNGAHAYAAHPTDGAGECVAIEVPPGTAPRALALERLTGVALAGVMAPLAHGVGKLSGRNPAYYVICPRPPGPALSAALRPWPEELLQSLVLRPVAAALGLLAARGVTHRALRPGNLFQARAGEPVVLGPAWAISPASRQPALYEPPYVAACDAKGRGEGSIADDIYALGVVLVVLALGREPVKEQDTATLVRQKLALGSFAAIVGDEGLSGELREIVRAMLAEDPEQRPSPALLLEPALRRARRAPPHPARRAAEPLVIGGADAFLPRSLARALAEAPEQGIRLLRLGVVERWVRRSLGDSTLGRGIEQAIERRARDAIEGEERADWLLLMRAVAVLDPLAPMLWRGISFWPDGLGAMLADERLLPALEDAIRGEVIGLWAACRAGRPAAPPLALEARRLRALAHGRGFSGGMQRVRYFLNPLLPCRSALLGDRVVVTVGQLLRALDAAGTDAEPRDTLPIDADIAGFILARAANGLEPELARSSPTAGPVELATVALRVFARLQRASQAGLLPGLGRWLLAHLAAVLAGWKERGRRAAIQERLSALAEEGDLGAMLSLIEDPAGRARDRQGLKQAEAALATIDAELARLDGGGLARAEWSRRLGQEIAAGIGLVAVAVTLAIMAFG